MEKRELVERIASLEAPRRKALSTKFPLLKRPILAFRRGYRKLENRLNYSIARTKSSTLFPCAVARHQSLLRRKLGDSDIRLQEGKVTNLRLACAELDGLIIEPGQVFSLWEIVGKPTEERGFVPGMLLSQGRVIEGVGGGLCQLANFLCWIFLHADTDIVERFHHSFDVFPDSGRTLPFGSGATVLYNFVDLKVKNTGDQPLQLHIFVTEDHLKGQLLAPANSLIKWHVIERGHRFVRSQGKYYRYNEIWRVGKKEGVVISEELVFKNFAPVLYKIDEEDLNERGYEITNLD